MNTSFERNYYLDMSPSYFPVGAPQVFFNGNQFQSTGSGITSVPYAKGYGEAQWACKNKGLLRFGADYEGNNNEYNAPAFFIFDAGAGLTPGSTTCCLARPSKISPTSTGAPSSAAV